jgi:hypothetical protein
MYHLMSVSQLHSRSPLPGSNPSTFCITATTSSVLPPSASTRSGVFHESRMSGARQTSLPVSRSSATSDVLSTLALMKTRRP